MSRNYNGTDQYGSRAGPWVTAYPWSACIWFYLSQPNSAASNVLFNMGDTGLGNNVWTCWVQSGSLIFSTKAGGVWDAIGATSAPLVRPFAWQSAIVVCASSTDRRVYLNGTVMAQEVDNLTPSGMDLSCIGVRSDATTANFFAGLLDEFVIWNAALTAAEVSAIGSGAKRASSVRRSSQAFLYAIGNGPTDYDRLSGEVLTQNGATVAPHAERRIILPKSPVYMQSRPTPAATNDDFVGRGRRLGSSWFRGE